ncbi:Serine-threonine/tyrosine-protein kinase, catalytic domain [Dillenia turbinata]|uniref:Serine-threonine/tyrosine-protein kinase, catalytic domain n=1 Tax=Dillenia turbinata TaxID=194707 RepID=A0AAN8UHA6_9MAGN
MGHCKPSVMGNCLTSSSQLETHSHDEEQRQHQQLRHTQYPKTNISSTSASPAMTGPTPSTLHVFCKFPFSDLKFATNNFHSSLIISKNYETTTNIVYKGRLRDQRWIAVKKYTSFAWPDRMVFASEAQRIGLYRHQRMVSLIGYCNDGDHRLLVAEFMPNCSLSMHLFESEDQMEWEMRIRIAIYLAEALGYCHSMSSVVYQELNADRVLFDQEGDPRLSCFGLISNYQEGGSCRSIDYSSPNGMPFGGFTSSSIVFFYGIILLNLFTGKEVHQMHRFRDSHITKDVSEQDFRNVIALAKMCLQGESSNRPVLETFASILRPLQKKKEVRSYIMLISKPDEPLPTSGQFSPMYEACKACNLEEVHNILAAAPYVNTKASAELSLPEGSNPDAQLLGEAKENGDKAFGEKEAANAIDFYSQVINSAGLVSPTVYARRSYCHLLQCDFESAFLDATQALYTYPGWPIAFYLQYLALVQKEETRNDCQYLLDYAAINEELWMQRNHRRLSFTYHSRLIWDKAATDTGPTGWAWVEMGRLNLFQEDGPKMHSCNLR